MHVPVTVVLQSEDGKLQAHGAMESFHQPITMDPQGGGARLVRAQVFAHRGKHLRLQLLPHVAVNDLQYSVNEHASSQVLKDRLCLLVCKVI